MKNTETYWITGALLIAVITTGLFLNFNYSDEVEIQLHDTYFIILPIHLAFIFWTILTFIIFLVKGINNRFSNNISTWVLLVTNTILTVLLLVISYMTYAFFSAKEFMDVFKKSPVGDTISAQYNKAMITWVSLIILFSTVEFLLIKRLIKLKRIKKSNGQ